MPYIGKSPLHGNFNELTDVSGSFDGSETEFALTENISSTAITPVMPAALIISINGVVQEPTTDYTVSGTNITFTTAPAATDSFFGIAMGKQLDVGTPSDSTVTPAKMNITSALVPASADGAALGSTSAEWSDLYLADGSTIQFGADQDVTVTHVADTGVLLNAASKIQFRDSGLAIHSSTDGQLDIDADVELEILTGRVDIQGSSDNALQITQSGAGNNGVRMIGSHASFTGNACQPWSVRDTNSAFDLIECVTNNGSAVPFRVRGDGQVSTIDNLLFTASGKGVYLGVTSATAANLLDDYEEGTWTPAFTSTSATFAYTTQGGNYTKVGRMCLATFRLELDGNAPGGTTSNSVFISGLPFAIATLADTYHGGSIGHYFSINLSQTGVLAYQLSSGASTVELKVVGDNLGETAVLASHLAGAAEIRGQILYHTA